MEVINILDTNKALFEEFYLKCNVNVGLHEMIRDIPLKFVEPVSILYCSGKRIHRNLISTVNELYLDLDALKYHVAKENRKDFEENQMKPHLEELNDHISELFLYNKMSDLIQKDNEISKTEVNKDTYFKLFLELYEKIKDL